MNHNLTMIARLSAFVIWAVVAAAVAFWGMRLLVHAEPAPTNAVVATEATAIGGDLSRLLGAEPVVAVAVMPEASTRFKLMGVMAAKASPQGGTPGFALISIDGKPPRAFAAGSRVEDQMVLKTVSLRSASFGPAQGPVAFTLEIPPLPPPATGVLQRLESEPMNGGGGDSAPPPMAQPPMQPEYQQSGSIDPEQLLQQQEQMQARQMQMRRGSMMR